MVVRAEGMYLWNDRGDRIIDASSGLFCVAAGHGRKEIADAVGRQLRELDFCAPFLRGAPEAVRARHARRRAHARRPQPDLLRQLRLRGGRHRDEDRARLPPGARPGRPHDVRLARARLSRRQLRRRRAVGPRQQPAQVRPGAARHRAHAAHAPQGELLHARAKARTAPSSPTTSLRFVNLYGAENIAACFVEPIAGSTGCLVPPKGYLERLREICDAHGILLVFDEVITRLRPHRAGVRRAELRRHARHHDDGQGAHQRRAADGRGRGQRAHPRHDHGARRPKARSSSSTATRTRAIPAPCAAGIATLDIYRNEGLFERGRELSPYFLDALFSLKDIPVVADIRGYGMMAAHRRRTPTARRARAARRSRRGCSTTASTSRPPATAAIIAPPLIAERSHVDYHRRHPAQDARARSRVQTRAPRRTPSKTTCSSGAGRVAPGARRIAAGLGAEDGHLRLPGHDESVPLGAADGRDREGDRLQDQLAAVRRRRRRDPGDGLGRRRRSAKWARPASPRRSARAWTSSSSGSSRTSRRPRRWSRATAAASTRVADLKGKKVGVPFVSTTHFHLLLCDGARRARSAPTCRSSTCGRPRSPPPGSAATSTRRSSGTRCSSKVKKNGKVHRHLGRARARRASARSTA